MKYLHFLLILISFVGTGVSGFFFTRIQKVIDQKLEEINGLTDENQRLEKTILTVRKNFNETQISLSETEVALATSKRKSSIIASRNSSLEERFSSLSKKFEISESSNKSFEEQVARLKNTIFEINSQKDLSIKKLAQLGKAIKRSRNQNQTYQSRIQGLEKKLLDLQAVNAKAVNAKAVNAKVVNAKVVDAKAVNAKAVNAKAVNAKAVNAKAVNAKVVDAKDLDNYNLVHFLAIDLSTGLVSLDLKKSSKVKDGTKILLKNMGFTIGKLKIIEIGEDYVIGNIEPGLNRFSSYNRGDTADVILLNQV